MNTDGEICSLASTRSVSHQQWFNLKFLKVNNRIIERIGKVIHNIIVISTSLLRADNLKYSSAIFLRCFAVFKNAFGLGF